uniref:MHC class I-like antigen recognition-like domain-containing protein n=1 Tax=Chelonoidis abingdonii TaxID=106734 RepID=A0A8C0IW53_CHEAB
MDPSLSLAQDGAEGRGTWLGVGGVTECGGVKALHPPTSCDSPGLSASQEHRRFISRQEHSPQQRFQVQTTGPLSQVQCWASQSQLQLKPFQPLLCLWSLLGQEAPDLFVPNPFRGTLRARGQLSVRPGARSETVKCQCHQLAERPSDPTRLQTHFQALSAGSQLSSSCTGVHTEQLHVTCALSGQAPVDPRFQYAYDGRDFISFDAQMGTWVAAMQPAFAQKQSWETGKTWTQFVQHYLQSECLGTLRSLVHSLRLPFSVSPQVSVSRRDTPDGSVTLSYILAEKDSSGILSNADNTYYRQSSLEISPQQDDGHRYACRVEHSSRGEPTVKGPLPLGILAAIVLAVLLLAGAVGAGVILWRRKSAGESWSPWSRDVGRFGAWGSPASPRGMVPPTAPRGEVGQG